MMGHHRIHIPFLRALFTATAALVLLFSAPASETQKPLSAFEQANRAYEQGHYREAIEGYELLLRHGSSPQILFNLGNASFKAGEIGQAILNYRRARRLAPRDADIQANLSFARQTVPGTASLQPGVLSRAAHYFSLDEMAILTATAFWSWLGFLAIRQFRPQWRSILRPWAAVSGAVFLAALVWLVFCLNYQTRPVAIVTAEQAHVRYGPLAESQVAYTVNDGAELLVQDARPDWIQVSDRSGRIGWLQRPQVVLFP